MDNFTKSRMRRRWNESNRFEVECFICKNMVASRKDSSRLTLISHDPNTGEKVKPGKGCLGMQFPQLAILPEMFVAM